MIPARDFPLRVDSLVHSRSASEREEDVGIAYHWTWSTQARLCCWRIQAELRNL